MVQVGDNRLARVCAGILGGMVGSCMAFVLVHHDLIAWLMVQGVGKVPYWVQEAGPVSGALVRVALGGIVGVVEAGAMRKRSPRALFWEAMALAFFLGLLLPLP